MFRGLLFSITFAAILLYSLPGFAVKMRRVFRSVKDEELKTSSITSPLSYTPQGPLYFKGWASPIALFTAGRAEMRASQSLTCG